MKGKFKLKQINKRTGESKVILEENNQVAAGFAAAMVNVLTGTGSSDVDDYKFRYFQLGEDNYNLSSFGVSADVPEERLKYNVWTMKSPMDLDSYGKDSFFPVVDRKIYGVGSIVPSNRGRLFDNFIDPPDDTLISSEYTNNFETFKDGDAHSSTSRDAVSYPATTWIAGCANAWEAKNENHFRWPLWVSAADSSLSGPKASEPLYVVQYNGSANVNNINSCVRMNTGYRFADGAQRNAWNYMKRDQTQSVYYSTEYYASSLSTSSSTPIGGALQIFNRTAQAGVLTQAGQNRVSFAYRYDLTKSSTDADAKWYPPEIIDASSGYQECQEIVDCVDTWESFYGVGVSGGHVSANIECSAGEMYAYSDVTASPPYSTRSGPGSDCYNQPNSGFGPSGNFYRISISLMDVPDEVINVDNGLLVNSVLQPMNYPLLSSLSEVTGGVPVGTDGDHNVTPREKAYISNFQFEYYKKATPAQYIHGERPSYVRASQKFVQIPQSYTTNLNDNTTNVRLLLDDYLANGKTIKEVGLFFKNPSGYVGVDSPFMSGYKILDPPLEKNEEFSYIIDWEISVVDTDNI